uniref:non-specific lipid transfer protein GPI-anchored 14 n=1 Tax=Erigeron canadensis TaxID=72917 RepID=UPI001CB957B0|nr:non-specific lipid transfer protein GPI-anchored 14 [Erigeron canadensis]
MCSKHGSNRLLPCLAMLVMVFLGITKADINKDKAQCGNQLVGLATCLPYVGGEAKAPTMQCCSGLKEVLARSKVCLCMLIKDRNDPSLNLKINETLALGLPDTCNRPTNISQCLNLLHLQPGSPDARVFEDFAKGTKSKNDTIVAPGGNDTYANATTSSSDGGRPKTWYFGPINIVGLFFIIAMLHILISNELVTY